MNFEYIKNFFEYTLGIKLVVEEEKSKFNEGSVIKKVRYDNKFNYSFNLEFNENTECLIVNLKVTSDNNNIFTENNVITHFFLDKVSEKDVDLFLQKIKNVIKDDDGLGV